MRMQFDRLSVLLGLTTVATVLVLAAEVATGVRVENAPELGAEIADAPAASSTLPGYVPQSFDSFSEILERPLFFADRQLPAEPKQELIAAAPLEPLRLTLEGIAIMDKSRIALLRSQGDNVLVQMAEGMTHNGWTLESVLTDRAIFKRGDDSTEIELETDTGSRRRH
jgi:hypothetical protein